MTIHKVTATIELYFHQDHEPDSFEISEAIQNEASDQNIDDYTIKQIESLDEVSAAWKDSCPYGEDGHQHTVAEWLLKS